MSYARPLNASVTADRCLTSSATYLVPASPTLPPVAVMRMSALWERVSPPGSLYPSAPSALQRAEPRRPVISNEANLPSPRQDPSTPTHPYSTFIRRSRTSSSVLSGLMLPLRRLANPCGSPAGTSDDSFRPVRAPRGRRQVQPLVGPPLERVPRRRSSEMSFLGIRIANGGKQGVPGDNAACSIQNLHVEARV